MWVPDKPVDSGCNICMYVWCNEFMKFEGALHWHCSGKGPNSVQVFLSLLLIK